MAYIKRLVMQGFKSFANRTEIAFDKGINVVIGPNGSGKSNISDALCFVLGRLSTKSMRAAKARNLLFMGSKYAKPAREANVELVFDNADRAFSMDKDEVSLMRTVRNNGLSIYKINGEVKTRADVLEALGQAGIDPHGFNMVLQGQIQAVVGMHPEDRRKVVEEVAGISIYETRKEKALHELEKTEERMKEINAILREKTAFLRNLENERQQALKFKDLELTIKRCKASLLSRRHDDKEHELGSIRKSIEEKTTQKDKIRSKANEVQQLIESTHERISQINKHIQHATGVEQDALHTHIANLKAELEGIKVRKENFEHRHEEIQRRIDELTNEVPRLEHEIQELRTESPLVAKKQAELQKKKQELAKIEESRKQAYTTRTELNSLKERVRDKESQRARTSGESDALVKQLEEYARDLKYPDVVSCRKALEELAKTVEDMRTRATSLTQTEFESTRRASSAETEIRNAEKIKTEVGKLDICPLCRSTITDEHIGHVTKEADEKIATYQKVQEEENARMHACQKERSDVVETMRQHERKRLEYEKELSRHTILADKKTYLKRLVDQEKILEGEIRTLAQRRDALQQRSFDTSNLEEQHTAILHEIEEISSRTEENLDQTLLFKERDMEKMKEKIKSGRDDLSQTDEEIRSFETALGHKTTLLEQREAEEAALTERFKKLFQERDDLQKLIQEKSYDGTNLQGEVRQIEEQINSLNIGVARLDAEREAIHMELGEYTGLELIKASVAVLEERLQKSQASMMTIGSINLRALEIYDQMKQEYEGVQEKVNKLVAEKEEVLKIVAEIDSKKRRTFMKTFNQINELFSTNYARLSTKGQAYLELENPESIFEGGVTIVNRMGKGKYFDISSLSGGEKTLVALSLLFAIQEYKPYHFYIFDEIDAALDKRNSERLSALLKQYMRAGQYITITHNDAIILDANVLYGVSMHEGVSKILSLKVGEEVVSKVAELLKQNPTSAIPTEPTQETPTSAEK